MSRCVSCESIKKPENLSCFLGFFTIILCIILNILSILHLMPVGNEDFHFALKRLKMTDRAVTFVAITTLIVGTLWGLVAVLLIVGIKKNLSGFVLCYFVYGTFLTIVVNLEALLLLLHSNWIMALCLTITSLAYVPCLIGVHKVWALMERGKIFGENQHTLLEESEA